MGRQNRSIARRAKWKKFYLKFRLPAQMKLRRRLCGAKRVGKTGDKQNFRRALNLFEKAAARLEAAAPKLARQMAAEIGKPLSHGLEEVRRAAVNIRDVIRRAANFELQTRAAAGMVRHQPLGIVAIISPWNNPVAIPVGKIAPALVYGNTVIWKPAPAATNISRAVLQLLRDSGVPRDAVQLLAGDHTTAQQLAANENVNAVTLTGSAQAGFAIQEICARRFVPLQAELNGNNAAIVWDDADLPHAAGQVAWGAFGFAGQRCTANRRVIVSKKNFGNLSARIEDRRRKTGLGRPVEKIHGHRPGNSCG